MNPDDICKEIKFSFDRVLPSLAAGMLAAYRNIGYRGPGLSPDQQQFLGVLHAIVTRLKIRHVIQTGTFVGHSTLALALAMEQNGGRGIIETVDQEPVQYGGLAIEYPVDYARLVIAAAGLSHRVIFYRGYSARPWDKSRQDLHPAPEMVLVDLARDQPADLLVIDGDHTFDGAFWDLELGYRALRQDGPRLIFIHDFTSIPEVRKAVRVWIRRHKNEIGYRIWRRYCGFALIQCQENMIAAVNHQVLPSTF